MATITTGIKAFNIPGIPWDCFAAEWHRALVSAPQAFSKICNLAWKGSTKPMILLTTKSMRDRWAEAQILGWGRGVIRFTSYPPLAKRMAAWSPDTLMSLIFHEHAHILANTWEQNIDYPPSSWLVSRLVTHWGMPRVALDWDEQLEAVEATQFAPQGNLPLWDRVRLPLCKPVPVTVWNGESVSD